MSNTKTTSQEAPAQTENTKRTDYNQIECQIHLAACDELDNGPLRYMTPEEIRKLTKELEQRIETEPGKPEFDDGDFPEYESVRKFLKGMKDREIIAFCLVKSLMFADNQPNATTGRYLVDLYSKHEDLAREKIGEIIINSEDPEIKILAMLCEVIYGLS